MNQGMCLLCFSVTKVLDIKRTQLQNVYEELSESKIQAESHPLCYICHAKLYQFKQTLKQIQENNSVNQSDIRPLLQLGTFTTDNNWSLPNNYVEIELQPTIKQEYITEDVPNDPEHCALETEVEIEYVKEEYASSSSHSEDETVADPVENQYTVTVPRNPKQFSYSSYRHKHKVPREANAIQNQNETIEDTDSEVNQNKMVQFLELQHQREISKMDKYKIIMDLQTELKRVQARNTRLELALKKNKMI